MRTIVTGQVGMEKKPYLDAVAAHAQANGERLGLFHIGDMMYAEAPDVSPGRILDLPLSRLNALRRSAFKDVIAQAGDHTHMIVNTHATFRWRHGLFAAFDFDQVKLLRPDRLVCLVDNIEAVHDRLHGEHRSDATLKDLMVWREEEIMATELLAQALGLANECYVVARGREQLTVESLYRLACGKSHRKVYPSFPMTHVASLPDVLAEIDAFRARLAECFITFDPGDVDEKLLLERALEAARSGQEFVEAQVGDDRGRVRTINVSVKQVLDIAGDIDGQIYTRDFKLIDQADMIVSYIPELPGGMPGLSSGVERELQHAFEHGKEVYVIWKPPRSPSPFVTETATMVFATIDEALEHFEREGMFPATNLFGA